MIVVAVVELLLLLLFAYLPVALSVFPLVYVRVSVAICLSFSLID